MEREERYLVLKYKDMLKHLTVDEQMALIELANKVDVGRVSCGKRIVQCVCVEDDWPEYEEVWAMIASRVDDVPLYKARMGIETHNMAVSSGALADDETEDGRSPSA